jgi:hypothetical protein
MYLALHDVHLNAWMVSYNVRELTTHSTPAHRPTWQFSAVWGVYTLVHKQQCVCHTQAHYFKT